MTHFEKEENSGENHYEQKSHEHKSHEHKSHESHKPQVYHENHEHDPKHRSEEVHKEHHKVHHKEHHEKKDKKKVKVDHWKIASYVLAVLLLISLFTGFKLFDLGSNKDNVASETLEYINTNMLQGQASAKLTAVNEEHGLYKMTLSLSGNNVDGYVTKDGALFFTQAIDTSGAGPQVTPPAAQPTPEVVKSDKPVVELFVMSHCPFGTQAEKGMLPIANLLGDKIDFSIKYVYYAMHGKEELDEQSKQVCIQDEQNDKFSDYLSCFLEAGDTESCLKEAKIDTAALTKCVAQLDKDYKITEKFNQQSTWLSGKFPLFDVHKAENDKYQIKGSPGLVINGAQANSARSPAAYLSTVCAAFNEVPEECENSEGVSTETFQPGFGYDKGAATAATCG